jgi:hypothetical protein
MFKELDYDDPRFDDFGSTTKTYLFHFINKMHLIKHK